MIDQVWNQQQIRTEFPDCESLEEIILRVTSQRAQKDELICGLRINGEFISEEREKELAGLSPNQLESLEIQSLTQHELLVNSIESQLDLVRSLNKKVTESYTSFRLADESTAQAQFAHVVEGCQFLAEVLGLLRQNLISVDEMDFTEVGWFEAEAKFKTSVEEMLAAYEAKDYQLAADILEYELGESLDLWQTSLTQCSMLLK